MCVCVRERERERARERAREGEGATVRDSEEGREIKKNGWAGGMRMEGEEG